MGYRRSLLLLIILSTTTLPLGAAAAGPITSCRTACAAVNLRASCAWLAPRARRCMHHALGTCVRESRRGLPAVCRPPADLPACLTNHGCPFGALCVATTCRVVPCATTPDGFATCTGLNTCQGDKCVVTDCAASDENCPTGLHCQPAADPFTNISGACEADDPTVTYCTTNTDCISAGIPNLVCARGRCVARGRGERTTTTTIRTTTTTTTLPGGGSRCSCRCGDDTVCTSNSDCGVDSLGIPNICGCPVSPPCDGHGNAH